MHWPCFWIYFLQYRLFGILRYQQDQPKMMFLCLLLTFVAAAWGTGDISSALKSCPALDSCRPKRSGTRELHSLSDMNCACDHLCGTYGDCCMDASIPKINQTNHQFECSELRQFGGVFMKTRCPLTYKGPDAVRHLCETENHHGDDPLGDMPVTDATSGVTYKNQYCGMCNEDHRNHRRLVMWMPRLECPSLTVYNNSRRNLTHDYVAQNLEWDGIGWGIYLDGDNGSLFFHDCEVDPVMPSALESSVRLCRPRLISECPEDWHDDETRKLCLAYMGVRYAQGERFRNAHCALCNGFNVSTLSCQSAEFREVVFFRTFERHAFSLLLDVDERTGLNVGDVRRCVDNEVFDPFFKRCRSLQCLAGHSKIGSTCQPIGNDTYNVTTVVINGPVGETDFKNGSGVYYNVSMLDEDDQLKKFQNCLLISLEVEDYVMFPNKSIYVPKYDKTYEPTSYHSRDGSVLICAHFKGKGEEKFPALMGYVTVVGLGISMLCLLLHLAAFFVIPDLQNLSGKNLASQCMALFCAYCSFIAGQMESLDVFSCTAAAFLTFYFFQASFFWMAAMAYDVWRTLKMATTELRVSSGRQLGRFAAYSIFSWVGPLLVVVSASLAEYTDYFPEAYRPGFAQPRCWFRRRRALLVFFAGPLVAIMLANLMLFASSARMIVATTTSKHPQRRNFKLYLRLALLMGLTWVVGLVAGYADEQLLWYAFVVMNSLQGLFVFVAFTCTSKTRGLMRDRWRRFDTTVSTGSTSLQSKPTVKGTPNRH